MGYDVCFQSFERLHVYCDLWDTLTPGLIANSHGGVTSFSAQKRSIYEPTLSAFVLKSVLPDNTKISTGVLAAALERVGQARV